MVKTYFKVLRARSIINLCGPERLPAGWTPAIIKKRRQQTLEYIERMDQKNGFYRNLEKSILDEGVRNPILTTAGFFSPAYMEVDPKPANTKNLKARVHPDLKNRMPEQIVCHMYGGSRLYMAQKHNLEIPCIINDFVGLLDGMPELKSIEDVLQYFMDNPEHISQDERLGISFSALPKVHMEKPLKPYKIRYAVLPSRIITNAIKPDKNRIEKMENECQFFSKLEASVLKEGFRNPICINAQKRQLTNRYGGSRLMIAQKHNLDIPCIIADYDDIFPNEKEIRLVDVRSYFKDPPRALYSKPEGINMSGCEHVHLKEDE